MTDLPPSFTDLPNGAVALIFDQIDSTNEEALRRIRAGEAEDGLWIVAQSQTSGRGRRGREWVSQDGNFFASVLVELNVPVKAASALSFVAALAVGGVINDLIGNNGNVSFKWPNDILIDGHKAAGILIEADCDPNSGLNWAVVGIGINTISAPQDVRYPATCVADCISYSINNNNVLENLSKVWMEHLYILNSEGFNVIRTMWQERAKGIGSEICVNVNGHDQKGLFLGLGEGGELLLQLPDGHEVKIIAGDVTELSL